MRAFKILVLMMFVLCLPALAGKVFVKTVEGRTFYGTPILCRDSFLLLRIPFGVVRIPIAEVEFISAKLAEDVPRGLVLTTGEVLPVFPSDLVSLSEDKCTFRVLGKLRTVDFANFVSLKFMVMKVKTTSGRTYIGEVVSYRQGDGVLEIVTRGENKRVRLSLSKVESIWLEGDREPPYGLVLKDGSAFFVTRQNLVKITGDAWVFNLGGKQRSFHRSVIRSLRFYPGRYVVPGTDGYWEYITFTSKGISLERLGERRLLKPSEISGIVPAPFWVPVYEKPKTPRPLCVEFEFGGIVSGEVSFDGNEISVRCGPVKVVAQTSAVARVFKPGEDVDVGYFKAFDPELNEPIVMEIGKLLRIRGGRVILSSPKTVGPLEIPYDAFRALRLGKVKKKGKLFHVRVGNVEVWSNTLGVGDSSLVLLGGRLTISPIPKYLPVVIEGPSGRIRMPEKGVARGIPELICPECLPIKHLKEAKPKPGKVAWKFAAKAKIESSPAIGENDVVYVGDIEGTLYALYPTGDLRWRLDLEGGPCLSPVVGRDGTIYLATRRGFLYAIRPDGTLKWAFEADGRIEAPPALTKSGSIILCTENGVVCAISGDGKLLWKLDLGDRLYSSPAISNAHTIYVGGSSGFLYALSKTGKILWKLKIGGEGIFAQAAVREDGTAYVACCDGFLYAVAHNGSVKWKLKIGDWIVSSPAVGKDGTIYVGSSNSYVYAIDPAGAIRWVFRARGEIWATPAVGSDGTVYVGSRDGCVYAISSNGNPKWRFKAGGEIVASPALGPNGVLYVGSCDGYLYAIATGSTGLAKSPWPCFGANSAHTGRVGR